MRSMDRAAWVGILVFASAGAFAAGAPTTPVAEAGRVTAVWVDHDLSFTYAGFTSHYSCDGLEDKVRYVVRQLGARPGFRVDSYACANSTGPEIMPRVRVRAALPQEATPQLLAQLEKTRATRELAARAGSQPAAAADAATAQFPATWRTVTFAGTPSSDVQDGDCELMEQLIRNVLVPMGVREVEGSILNCVPHQVAINAVNVKLRVLAPPAEPVQANAPGRP